PGAAIDLLQRYDPPSREVLLALLQVAAPLGEGGLDHASPQETAALLEQLNGLQAVLRRRAPPAVRKMRFCRALPAHRHDHPRPPSRRQRPAGRGSWSRSTWGGGT